MPSCFRHASRSERRRAIAAFREAHGPDIDCALLRELCLPVEVDGPEGLAFRDPLDAQAILAELYPDFDPYASRYPNCATADQQARLIDGLARFRSERIDDEICRLFRSASLRDNDPDCDQADFDRLALSCLARLASRVPRRELLAFVERRVGAIEALPENAATRRNAGALSQWRESLSGLPGRPGDRRATPNLEHLDYELVPISP